MLVPPEPPEGLLPEWPDGLLPVEPSAGGIAEGSLDEPPAGLPDDEPSEGIADGLVPEPDLPVAEEPLDVPDEPLDMLSFWPAAWTRFNSCWLSSSAVLS